MESRCTFSSFMREILTRKSAFFHFVGSVGVKYELIICLDGMPVVVSV